MKRRSSAPAFLAAALLLAAAMFPSTARAHGTSVNITTDDDLALDSCDGIKVRFGEYHDSMPMAREEERLTVARSSASPLRIQLSDAGGMRIQGWDRDEYAVRVCKAAGAWSLSSAQRALKEVSVSLENGRITASGPEEGTWLVYLIIQAPRNADLELETENGEIGLTDVSGRVRARSGNGPISLKKCSREISATTENGPISVKGGSGDHHLRTENGPISVDLAGGSWHGGGLEARTENGPLDLNLPGNYRSAIRVEATGHSPMECKAKACRTARKSWDEDTRWVEFGSGPFAVRLSTVNGPVSIKSRVSDV